MLDRNRSTSPIFWIILGVLLGFGVILQLIGAIPLIESNNKAMLFAVFSFIVAFIGHFIFTEPD